MNIVTFSIRHPVTTILSSLAIAIAGLVAFFLLPVALQPKTDYPTITIDAQLPGASPEVMATTVATPLLKQLTGLSGVNALVSSSTRGAVTITMEFSLRRPIDAAAADVQAALARARSQLPAEMTTQPTWRKTNPNTFPMLWLVLKSDTLSLPQMGEIARMVVAPQLSTVEGTAFIRLTNDQKRAIRIAVDPAALAARGISMEEVQAAVQAANASTPIGVLKSAEQELIIKAETQRTTADELAQLVVATRDGRPVRLGELARVLDGTENPDTIYWQKGERAVAIGVVTQPEANAVDVVERAKALLPAIRAQLPAAVTLEVSYDRSGWVRPAIVDAQYTLLLTMALVILVVLLFLRRATATLIPALAVPISILATLAAMYALDFSLNNISMLALTISVGLVVDDAIVMLENIVRRMEEDGLGPFEAAIEGAREIGFTILSISFSLVAVFIPVFWMGGVVGRIFHEFAVVVTVAILASAFVSLTLTPMLCARLLRQPGTVGGTHAAAATPAPGLCIRLYDRSLVFCIRHQTAMVLVFAATMAATIWLAVTAPKGLLPTEDTGRLALTIEGRPDMPFAQLVERNQAVADIVRASPHVDRVENWVEDKWSVVLATLKPRSERAKVSVVVAELRRETARLPGISVYLKPIQSLNIGVGSSRSEFEYTLRSTDPATLAAYARRMVAAMRPESKIFADVSSDLQADAPSVSLIVDRTKADMLGIPIDALRSTLYSGFGARQITSISTVGESYPVILELDPRLPWSPERIGQIQVRSKSGTLVPISAFARIERSFAPVAVKQVGLLNAVTISFNLPEGVALGDAVRRLQAIENEFDKPAGIIAGFSGTAQAFQSSVASNVMLIVAALVAIYILLGMLYESFLHPLTILAGLPSAAIGAFLALRLAGMDLTVIAVIGLLMLIGIVKKNAIMMIDVALVLQRGGLAADVAIRQACLMRVRPIMMTTLAAIAGALPIALGWGAGAELRQPLGVAVVGGLVVSQAVTLLITPALYLGMERLARYFRRSEPKPALSDASAVVIAVPVAVLPA